MVDLLQDKFVAKKSQQLAGISFSNHTVKCDLEVVTAAKVVAKLGC